jgi:hypothetical protein
MVIAGFEPRGPEEPDDDPDTGPDDDPDNEPDDRSSGRSQRVSATLLDSTVSRRLRWGVVITSG